MKRVALLLALCAGAAACGKVQAKTPAPPPALTVPEPPTRVVVPVNVDPPAPPPATTEKPAPTTSARPPGARPTPTPVGTPTPSPTPTNSDAQPPVLQTSANLGELENKARAGLEKAQKDLGRITRSSLGKDAQDQFDSAERYVRMASDAMKMKNFIYASFCADKASTLAGLLIK